MDEHECIPLTQGDMTDKVSCAVCGLAFAITSHTQAKVAAYLHIVRAHPEEYEQVVGHPPEDEEVRMTTYALLEGVVSYTEVE